MVHITLYIQAHSVLTAILAHIGNEEILKTTTTHFLIYNCRPSLSTMIQYINRWPDHTTLVISGTHRTPWNSYSAPDAGPFQSWRVGAQMLRYSTLTEILPLSASYTVVFFFYNTWVATLGLLMLTVCVQNHNCRGSHRGSRLCLCYSTAFTLYLAWVFFLYPLQVLIMFSPGSVTWST